MNQENKQKLQLEELNNEFDRLHSIHGESDYMSIYGAWCIQYPEICLIFMNPTARNIAANPNWTWIRAPWLGLKQTWKMLYDLGFISREIASKTQADASNRTPEFAHELYEHLASRKIFITNLAKCTQSGAKHLPDTTFKEYLPTLYEEIALLQPKKIVIFGNQVSSIILEKPITVSSYEGDAFEIKMIHNQIYQIYPCRYPVGMGFRNMAKAKERVRSIIGNKNPLDQNSFMESQRDHE